MPNDDPENETGLPESEMGQLGPVGLVVAMVLLAALMGGLIYVATGLQ